jgi:hypothetical protein
VLALVGVAGAPGVHAQVASFASGPSIHVVRLVAAYDAAGVAIASARVERGRVTPARSRAFPSLSPALACDAASRLSVVAHDAVSLAPVAYASFVASTAHPSAVSARGPPVAVV